MRICFVNTAVPVVPLFEDAFPRLVELGWDPFALVSAADYRPDDSLPSPSGDRVLRVPCPAVFAKRKLLRHLVFALLAPWRILREQPDRVVFLTQPPFFHCLGAFLCRIAGIPYAVHVMDQYPEVLSASGKLAENGFVSRLLRRLVGQSYRRAAALVSLGPCMTERLVRDYGIDFGRIAELPNWAFRGIVPVELDANRFLREEGLEGKFVILYSGNLGLGHDVETIAGLIAGLAERGEVHFLFIGGGRGSEHLRARFDGSAQVRFLGFQPRERLAETLSTASIHLVSLRREFTGVMVPSKLYGCLASGRPVLFIGNRASTVATTIEAAGCGVVVENGDVAAAVGSVFSYVNDPAKTLAHGRAARDWYEREGLPEIAAARYARGIDAIFRGENP